MSTSDSPSHNELGTMHSLSGESVLQPSPNSSPNFSSARMDVSDRSQVEFINWRSSEPRTIAQSHWSKQRSTSSLNWGWLMVLISIGVHSILLLTPIPSEPKPTPPKPEKQIRITQLPTAPKPPAVKASPQPSPSPKKIPPVSKSVTRPQPIIESKKPQPESTPPEPRPKPSPSPQPTPEQTPQSQPNPEPSPSPTSSPSSDNSWEDFPRYPEAQAGCFKLQSCFQTGKDLNQVAQFFEKELSAKHYEAKPTIQEATRKVYQVSKNGMTQFLNLIFAGGDEGTVYVLGTEAVSLSDFKTAVEVPPEVANILMGLDPQKADSSYFAEPNFFYAQSGDANSQVPLPGISNISLILDQTADTMMDAFLSTNLRNNNFEIIDPPKQYAGGQLYEVRKDQLKLYINLIPTKDAKNTLVVIWGSPPI